MLALFGLQPCGLATASAKHFGFAPWGLSFVGSEQELRIQEIRTERHHEFKLRGSTDWLAPVRVQESAVQEANRITVESAPCSPEAESVPRRQFGQLSRRTARLCAMAGPQGDDAQTVQAKAACDVMQRLARDIDCLPGHRQGTIGKTLNPEHTREVCPCNRFLLELRPGASAGDRHQKDAGQSTFTPHAGVGMSPHVQKRDQKHPVDRDACPCCRRRRKAFVPLCKRERVGIAAVQAIIQPKPPQRREVISVVAQALSQRNRLVERGEGICIWAEHVKACASQGGLDANQVRIANRA
jgi:hypothetical protein